MKLGTLLFAAFVLILTACFSYPALLIADRLRIIYLESAEEPLVDMANVLAEVVGQSMEREPLDIEALYGLAQGVANRDVNARIYEITKERVDLNVYITNARGKLLFASEDRALIGADYSRWLDVSRTLRGEYGARISSNPADPSLPRLLYVAAPIRVRGDIVGVLTVVKPTTAVRTFLGSVRPQLIALGALALGTAVLLAFLVSLWLSQQVGRLARYADQVREGERVPFPKLARTELRDMGLAFERMRASLAGQAYVERYVQALSHEIKSPISAIRGAAEILETPDLEAHRRTQFLGNIQNETKRIQDLVDRMLALSALELHRALPKPVAVSLAPLLRTIVEAHEPMALQRTLHVDTHVPDELSVQGDPFLLHLAISNLVKNAMEFSPEGGRIRIEGETAGDDVRLRIEDEGPGIPDYARERIFERFYSLERPGTGRKSTGLGLNIVKEIVELHGGSIAIANREEGGLRATITVPIQHRSERPSRSSSSG